MIQVEDSDMSRVCDLTGKRRLVGNKVSHANNKTKMTQKPNLQTKRVFDPVTGETVSVEDVYAWFSRFKDSQNIYKQLNLLEVLGQKELVFFKENQPEERLSFYLNLSEVDVVILTSISDGEVFRFEKIDP